MILSFHEEEEGLPDSFLSNFPSLIKVDIHAKVTDPSVAKSMMGCLLSSLKANGRWQAVIATFFVVTERKKIVQFALSTRVITCLSIDVKCFLELKTSRRVDIICT